MNIYWREMKAHRKSLIIWCIGVVVMVVSGMGKYTSQSGTGQSMNELMKDMPKSLQAIMGTGVFDLSKASGYYGVLFLYLVLMATIHACLLGANMISKEERDKTSEFLFVKPISRKKIISMKLTAALTNVTVFNFTTLVTSLVILRRYSEGEEGLIGDILLLMIGMFLLQLLFMVIGTGMASVTKNPKSASSYSTGILMLTFILSIIIDLNERLEFLIYLSPYKYFEAKKLIFNGGFDAILVMITIIIIGVLLGVTYVSFEKKDLKG